jgi:hypothetical protein
MMPVNISRETMSQIKQIGGIKSRCALFHYAGMRDGKLTHHPFQLVLGCPTYELAAFCNQVVLQH